MVSNRSIRTKPYFSRSYSAEIKVKPSVVQVALVGVVEAVLPVDLFEVFAENWLMSEHHITVVAAVGLVPAVKVQVIQQRTLLSEGLAADFTLEGFDASVDAHVSVQVALLRESLAAQ